MENSRNLYKKYFRVNENVKLLSYKPIEFWYRFIFQELFIIVSSLERFFQKYKLVCASL